MTKSRKSVSMWSHLPAIFEREGMVHRIPDDSKLNKSTPEGILKPEHVHVTTIEGQRALLIIDSAITKVLLVAAFPRIAEDLPSYELLLGREITLMFKKYHPLATEYNEICVKLNLDTLKYKKKSMIVPVATINLENRARLLKEQIYKLSRLLLRSLMNEGRVVAALVLNQKHWNFEPDTHVKDMLRDMIQLRFLLRQEVLTTPKERARRDIYTEETQRLVIKQTKTVENLLKRLAILTEKQHSQIAEKTAEITSVAKQILELETITKDNISKIENIFQTEYRKTNKKHIVIKEILSDNLKSQQKESKISNECNVKQEIEMRRQKWKVEDELDITVIKTDERLFDLQKHIDQISEQCAKEKDAYNTLMDKFSPMKLEYSAIMEIKSKEIEDEKKQQEESEVQTYSATFIQSFYRAFKSRQILNRQRNKKPTYLD